MMTTEAAMAYLSSLRVTALTQRNQLAADAVAMAILALRDDDPTCGCGHARSRHGVCEVKICGCHGYHSLADGSQLTAAKHVDATVGAPAQESNAPAEAALTAVREPTDVEQLIRKAFDAGFNVGWDADGTPLTFTEQMAEAYQDYREAELAVLRRLPEEGRSSVVLEVRRDEHEKDQSRLAPAERVSESAQRIDDRER